MRGKNNFSDVILACEDGQEFAAQKMILGTSTIQPFLPQVVKGELTKAHQLIVNTRGAMYEDRNRCRLSLLWRG